MLDKYVEELFAPPVNASIAFQLDGDKYYTSKNLKLKFVEAITSADKTKSMSPKIMKLVQQGKIVPVWLNPNILKMAIFKKYSMNWAKKSLLGFYTKANDMVVMVIDNNSSVFGLSKDNELSKILVHELIHMASKKMKKQFLSTFKKELDSYYKEAFRRIFVLDPKKEKEWSKDVEKIYTFIFNEWELKRKMKISKYKDLINKSFKDYTLLNEDQFNEKLALYFVVVRTFFINADSFFNNINYYRAIIGPLYHAYEKIMPKVPPTMCIQELFFPSEVIAIYSEGVNDSKIKKAINSI